MGKTVRNRRRKFDDDFDSFERSFNKKKRLKKDIRNLRREAARSEYEQFDRTEY